MDPAEGNKVRRFQTTASDWVPSHRQHQVEFPFPPGFLVWQGGQPLPISSRFSSFPCCDPVHSPSKLSFLPHLLILPVSLSLPSASLDSPCCRSSSPARPDLRHHLTLFQSRLCVCARVKASSYLRATSSLVQLSPQRTKLSSPCFPNQSGPPLPSGTVLWSSHSPDKHPGIITLLNTAAIATSSSRLPRITTHLTPQGSVSLRSPVPSLNRNFLV